MKSYRRNADFAPYLTATYLKDKMHLHQRGFGEAELLSGLQIAQIPGE